MNFRILYIIILIPYVAGLFLPLMEADSAQHATMAMRMYVENDFLNIIKFHTPYLDKPHLHFWLAALSFKLFGLSEFTYRLPAFLFLMAGAYATFRLGKLLYNKFVGNIAALIFLSAQTIILSAHDVRTDAVLTGAAIIALWKIVAFIKNQKVLDIALGAFFLGIAFSTKGLIAVVFLGLCIICYLLYERNWLKFFNWKLFVGLGVFMISISPVLYAYYYQFDLHPELLVDGQKNISGVRFILWDQVFNRLNSKGFEQNSPDYFFFFHTLLWVFIPFSIIAYLALYDGIKQMIQLKFKKARNFEFLTLGGFLSMLLLISFSKFKLPHYLNVLVPVLSIVCANYLYRIKQYKKIKTVRTLLIIQYISIGVLAFGGIILSFFVFEISNWIFVTISLIGLLGLIIMLFKLNQSIYKLIFISVAIAAWLNFNLNTMFYPKLLNYQGGKQIAELILEKEISKQNVYLYETNFNWSLDFNLKQNTKSLSLDEIKHAQNIWLVLNSDSYKQLKNEISIKEVHKVKHFRITRLSLEFLKQSSREHVLDVQYLVKL